MLISWRCPPLHIIVYLWMLPPTCGMVIMLGHFSKVAPIHQLTLSRFPMWLFWHLPMHTHWPNGPAFNRCNKHGHRLLAKILKQGVYTESSGILGVKSLSPTGKIFFFKHNFFLVILIKSSLFLLIVVILFLDEPQMIFCNFSVKKYRKNGTLQTFLLGVTQEIGCLNLTIGRLKDTPLAKSLHGQT